jgi:DNA-binding IclR family transcriptional regulator
MEKGTVQTSEVTKPKSRGRPSKKVESTVALPGEPEKKQRRGIQSVEIAFGILDVLCRADSPLPLRTIAEQTGLSVANTHYYLVSFQNVGVVTQDSQTGFYGLGKYALKLGVAALRQFDVYQAARPLMAQLSVETGYTIFLGVWGNHGPTIVYRVEGGKSSPLLELRVGSVLPVLSSALGRNFLSFLPESVTNELVARELEKIERSTQNGYPSDLPRTVEDVKKMRSTIRERGLSSCQDALLPHFISFSAPIFDQAGEAIAGLTIMGATAMFDEGTIKQVTSALLGASNEISNAAGWNP